MLKDQGRVRHTLAHSRTLGFLPRGAPPAPGAVAVSIPECLPDAEQSVCGLKAFLIDERRAFLDGDRETVVDCARVALLDIADSPVHVHGETVETYHILSGEGRMILGASRRRVGAGDLMLLPPGLPHGLAADDPARPLRVLMTFSPGLAPVKSEQFRDERILHPSTRTCLAEGIDFLDHISLSEA